MKKAHFYMVTMVTMALGDPQVTVCELFAQGQSRAANGTRAASYVSVLARPASLKFQIASNYSGVT
jgi:hypothetical protein